ncbi:MAG: glycosyltransferase [Gammaproteobacteria bacterium]|nr:glycosyltransferase [Gammaproteobacteria bacterium]
MKISVVTVVRNAAATIEDTLRSVVSQDHPDVEHIVVDGASVDGTLEVLNRYRPHLAQLVSEPDSGIYAAMNKGWRLARGEVIGFLNADDIYAHSGVLAKIQTALADSTLDACYADLVYVRRQDVTRMVRYWTSQPFRPGLFEYGWLPAHPTFFVRRHVYERYGGFDERYRIQSDFEIALRFLEIHRINSVYVPEILVCMRMGGITNRSLRTILKGNLESYQACRAHGLSVTPWFFVRKWAMRAPQFVRRPRVGQTPAP